MIPQLVAVSFDDLNEVIRSVRKMMEGMPIFSKGSAAQLRREAVEQSIERIAGITQLAEYLICNQKVACSTHAPGSIARQLELFTPTDIASDIDPEIMNKGCV